MLPGVGGTELVVIAIVALIVVGPKDLPMLMRKVGHFLNRVRGMAAEFRASFDEMARQSELDELRKEVEALRKNAPFDSVRDDLDSTRRDIEASLSDHTTVYSPDWREDLPDTPSEPLPPEPAAADPAPETPAQPKPKRVRKAKTS